ncbi:MAG: DegT/DnrJ/EryC1/StrS family aminotransferase [Burkholderiales bacterium]|nr:DegT/DnrJ/EryC1/StrS family aminotransferase [Burkholderiales bacterium]
MRVELLVPDMPTAAELLPWLERIDANRWYTNFGPLAGELEARLREELQAAGEKPLFVTSVSNATAGLELTLAALGVKPGARVLVPALTFVASATAIVRAGCEPVVADIDAGNWTLTPAIAQAACARTRVDAVLTVSTFGVPHEVAAWDDFSARTSIPALIDAAGAWGNQRCNGRTPVVFSLHATKSLGAGEGGLIASTDSAIVSGVRRATNFGINLDASAPTPFGQVAQPGTNAKLSEYHAAVGLANLARWNERATRRRALMAEMRTRLAALPGLVPAWQQGDTSLVRTLLSFGVASGSLRDAIEEACALAGIATRRWYLPTLDRHPAFVTCERAGELPVATRLCETLIGLPFHLHLASADKDAVIVAVERGVARCANTAT